MSGRLSLVGSEAEIKAVPILDMQKDGQGFEPIFDVFEEIFDNVRDFPVAIISIAGPFRKGKSFLLNLLAHYLLENQSSTWFKNGDTQPERVFEWKGGAERSTVGIHITNKPFMLETSNNKKVAVFLMDTQGMFDTKTTATDCSTIFALSTLLSSVQIYNLTEQIQENDLQQFEVFTKYAKYAAEEKQHVNSSTTPFQSLMLLIRNWEKADFDSNFKGGAKYLESVMKSHIEENKSVRQNIRKSFSEVACFPMEHPGKKVTKRKGSDDSGVPLKGFHTFIYKKT
ncbi:atlastin-2-like [Ciona intestinalis]